MSTPKDHYPLPLWLTTTTQQEQLSGADGFLKADTKQTNNQGSDKPTKTQKSE